MQIIWAKDSMSLCRHQASELWPTYPCKTPQAWTRSSARNAAGSRSSPAVIASEGPSNSVARKNSVESRMCPQATKRGTEAPCSLCRCSYMAASCRSCARELLEAAWSPTCAQLHRMRNSVVGPARHGMCKQAEPHVRAITAHQMKTSRWLAELSSCCSQQWICRRIVTWDHLQGRPEQPHMINQQENGKGPAWCTSAIEQLQPCASSERHKAGCEMWRCTELHTFTATRFPLMQPSYTRPVRPPPISAVSPSSSRLQTSFERAAGLSLQKACSSCLTADQLATCTATSHRRSHTQEAALTSALGNVVRGESMGRSAVLNFNGFAGCLAALHMVQDSEKQVMLVYTMHT